MKVIIVLLALHEIRLFLVACDIYDERSGKKLSNETSYKLYNIGVGKGIIDKVKYPYQSFLRDEVKVFKDMYREFSEIDSSINYQDWLILNNFGIISETGESYFDPKIVVLDAISNKKFIDTVKAGDVLITGHGMQGLLGHTAIMTSDNDILEMPGGKFWSNGVKDNNKKSTKQVWIDEHKDNWIVVYRCPDNSVAKDAAQWAYRNYFNPSGGSEKTIHIEYKITFEIESTNPSYCSKLVIQSFYFGSGGKKVITPLSKSLIIPTSVPKYFLKPYTLQFITKF